MRIAYLDCFAGIAGDMFLGALVDAGVPLAVLEEAAAALAIGASLQVETADRSGISATKVHVLEDGMLAEGHAHEHQHEHEHPHAHGHEHEHAHGHEHHAGPAGSGDQPQDAAVHEPHPQKHSHAHGRSLRDIRALLTRAPLQEPVKQLALRAFDLLGHAEARIHNVPVEEIHFHEVGAVDAIVDIVAASAGVHHLQIDAWVCSALNVGGGMVECAHGTFPVPAPAAADLLRGLPTYSAHLQKELITPTGAALLRALAPRFGAQPAMRVQQIGYGAGTRNPKGFPNVLRLLIGEAVELADGGALPPHTDPAEAPGHPHSEAPPHEHEHKPDHDHQHKPDDDHKPAHKHKPDHGHGHHASLTVNVLETALDDLSPQLLAHVAEQALAQGALDVMLTPVVMKKGRPGTLLTILCNPADSHALEHLVLRETSTLGIRIRQDRCTCLERSHLPVETPYGSIRIKVGSLNGKQVNAAPEFEDCRAAAAAHRVPVKQVQQAAIAAWLR